MKYMNLMKYNKVLKSVLPKIKNYNNKEKIILRDHLAIERTILSNERTLLSYIRISIYLTLGGLFIINMSDVNIFWVAYLLFIISGFIITFGLIRYFILRNKLRNFYDIN